MPTNLDYLAFTTQSNLNWVAQKTYPGLDQPKFQSDAIFKQQVYGTQAANTAVYGADEMTFVLLNIAAASATTVDLTSFTDILGQTASLARQKFCQMRLLASGEKAPDGTTQGTTATQVVVGNASTDIFPLNFGSSAGSALIDNGGRYEFAMGSTAGITVSSGRRNVKILNSDAVVSAVVLMTFVGGSS